MCDIIYVQSWTVFQRHNLLFVRIKFILVMVLKDICPNNLPNIFYKKIEHTPARVNSFDT